MFINESIDQPSPIYIGPPGRLVCIAQAKAEGLIHIVQASWPGPGYIIFPLDDSLCTQSLASYQRTTRSHKTRLVHLKPTNKKALSAQGIIMGLGQGLKGTL
ncbi:hypothetical protein HAX54_002894, partial [Datura stramonium]|nr:hypothetical protein [Datura stramonium]